jgi:hypothetical protein
MKPIKSPMESAGRLLRATRSSMDSESPFLLISKRELNESNESNSRDDSLRKGPGIEAEIRNELFVISGLTVRTPFKHNSPNTSLSHLLAADPQQGLSPSLRTEKHRSPRTFKLHGPRSRRDSETSHLLEEAKAVADSKNYTEPMLRGQGHSQNTTTTESNASTTRISIYVVSENNSKSINKNTTAKQEGAYDQRNNSLNRHPSNTSPVANGYMLDSKEVTKSPVHKDEERSISKKRKRASLTREEVQHQRAHSTPAETIRNRLEHSQHLISTRSNDGGQYEPRDEHIRDLHTSADGAGEFDIADPSFPAPHFESHQDYMGTSPRLPDLSIDNLRQHEFQLKTIHSDDIPPSAYLEPIGEASDSSSPSIGDQEANQSVRKRKSHRPVSQSIEGPSSHSRAAMPFVKAESDLDEELDAIEDLGSQSGQSLEGAMVEDNREEASGYSSSEQRSADDERLRIVSKICPSCNEVFKNVTKLVSRHSSIFKSSVNWVQAMGTACCRLYGERIY